jgi:hypothetical protein
VPQGPPAGAGYRASAGHLAVQDGLHGHRATRAVVIVPGTRPSDV